MTWVQAFNRGSARGRSVVVGRATDAVSASIARAAAAWSAQGTSQLALAAVPITGIPPRQMPISVRLNSGGRKISPNGCARTSEPARRRSASHRGDSDTATNTQTPITAGTAPTSKVQRQSSGVIATTQAMSPSSTKPTLAAAPIRPATNGRDSDGRASTASETALGHAPPTPRQAINRSANSVVGSVANTEIPVTIE